MSEVILSMLFERRSSSFDHFVLQLDQKKSSVSAWIGHRDLLRRLQGQLAARETVRVEQESGQDGVTAHSSLLWTRDACFLLAVQGRTVVVISSGKQTFEFKTKRNLSF